MHSSTPHPENCAEASKDLSVAFLLIPDFTLMAFTGFVEALRHAADEGDRSRQLQCTWTILSPTRAPIRSSCGAQITPWENLRDPEDFDYIVVVGGLVSGHEHTPPAIYDYLRLGASKSVKLIGLCTGSFILARAGLMAGYHCCVHHFHLTEFESAFPDTSIEADRLFVIDRDRITCAGGVAGIDLAVHLVETHCGRERALKAVHQMVFDDVRRHDHPQARIGLASTWFGFVADPRVRRAILLMEQHIGSRLTMGKVAARLGITSKQLERSFLSTLRSPPATMFRKLRIGRARWLLENTDKPVTAIALDCGFADSSHLARIYRSEIGETPSATRRRCEQASARPRDATRVGP